MKTPEKDKDKIDDLVRKSLAGYEVPYRPEDWKEMQQKLEGKKGFRKGGSFFKLLMLITGIAAVSGASYFYLQDPERQESANQKNIVEETGRAQEKKKEHPASQENIPAVAAGQDKSKENIGGDNHEEKEAKKVTGEEIAENKSGGAAAVENQPDKLIALNNAKAGKDIKEKSPADYSLPKDEINEQKNEGADNQKRPESNRETTPSTPEQPADSSAHADSALIAFNTAENKTDAAASPPANDSASVPAKPEEDYVPPPKKSVPKNMADKVILDFSENPAFAGMVPNHKMEVRYYDQWLAMPFSKRPTALRASYDGYFEKYKSALGAYYSLVQTGNTSLKTFNLSYAYRVFAKEKMEMRIGLSANYNIKALDPKGLTFAEQLSDYGFLREIQQDVASKRKEYWQLNGGIYQKADNFYFAVSIFNINAPNTAFGNSESKLPVVLNIHSGYHLPLGNSMILLPALSLRQSNNLSLFSLYALMQYRKRMLFGIGLKDNNQLSGYLGYDIFSRLQFRVAAGYPLSKNLRTFGSISSVSGNIVYQFQKKK